MAVLGSCLIEKEAAERALDVLTDKDFYQESHRRLFRAVQDLAHRGQPIDVVTLGEELRRVQALDEVGGMAALTDLTHRVATAAHIEHYARLVKEKSVLRELIKTSTEVVSACYAEEKEASQLLDEAQRRILQVSEKQNLSGVIEARDLVHEVIEQMEQAHRNKEAVTGVPTGLTIVDKETTGLQKSDLILIAARPGQGKTSLALNIAANVTLAAREPKPLLFFSLEMNRHAIMQRLFSSEAGVNLRDVRTGFFPRNKWADLTNTGARLEKAPLYIVDNPGMTVVGIRSASRRLAAELKSQGRELGMVMVDYLQLIRGSGRVENRQQEVSEISRGLKFLARDLDVPVVALAQLSRRSEEKGRGDDLPQLSHLRESGALEQDADLILFIHRESQYKRNDPTLENKAKIIIAKNRQGPTGVIDVAFIGELTKFGNETMDQAPGDLQEAQAQFMAGS